MPRRRGRRRQPLGLIAQGAKPAGLEAPTRGWPVPASEVLTAFLRAAALPELALFAPSRSCKKSFGYEGTRGLGEHWRRAESMAFRGSNRHPLPHEPIHGVLARRSSNGRCCDYTMVLGDSR